MADYKVDLRDIKFVLFEQLKLQDLLGKAPYEDYDQETLEMMLGEAVRFSDDVLMPMNVEGDHVGVRYDDGAVITPPGFKEAWKTFAANGWVGFTANPEYGGAGAPHTIEAATSDIFEGACLAFNLTRLLTAGAARLIATFGTDALKQGFVPRMLTGEWTGTMCLTEAGAGTDVGASRTTATPEGDHYLIEGEKVFITSGEHDMADNIIHAVLARTPGSPPGTKGLSLFLVPKVRVGDDGKLGEANHVRALRIEEKMGIHGSPTCVMGFGVGGPTHGYLLGEEGAGMREMFQMMNEARLSVGIEGAAMANASYLQALEYTRERVQGRDITRRKQGKVSIVEHPDVRRMLLWSKAHAEGIRALGYFTASCIDRSRAAAAAGDEKEAARWHGVLEVLTPVIKAYGSDTGFRVADMAMQCYGGYGYTSEYPAEQFVRDSRISRIYEGANGIQALDLVGRKLGQHGGADAMALFGELGNIAKGIQGPGLGGVAERVGAALGAMGKVAQGFAKGAKAKPLMPLLGAYEFLELVGETTAGVLLGQQAALATAKLGKLAVDKGADPTDERAVMALAEDDEEAKFLLGKIVAARYFADHILVLLPAKADVILGGDMTPMAPIF